jgi:hypothetical protein
MQMLFSGHVGASPIGKAGLFQGLTMNGAGAVGAVGAGGAGGAQGFTHVTGARVGAVGGGC